MIETYAERLKRNKSEFGKDMEEWEENRRREMQAKSRPTITDSPKDIDELHPIMEPQIPGPNADRNVENVIKDLRWRAEKGLQKYGVTTERNDLSVIEWLQHLQEELMDATVYIEKLKTQIEEEY